jgi:hypothetical protein
MTLEAGVELLGRQRDKDVGSIARQSGKEPLGLLHARREEGGFSGRIAFKHQVLGGFGGAGALRIVLDDDKRDRLGAQLPADHLPDAAKATDHVMGAERRNALLHASPPKDPLELPRHDRFRQRHDRVQDNPDARHQEGHREPPARGAERVHFQVADRGEGNDGHVEGVEPGVVRQEAVAEHARHDHEYDEQDGDPQPGERPHIMVLLLPVAGPVRGGGLAPVAHRC